MELTRKEQEEFLLLIEEAKRRQKYSITDFILHGENARFYKKHCELLNKTGEYKIVYFSGANQTGKTTTAAKWVSMLATGIYESWYTGARFDHPVNVLCIGRTHAQSKDVWQKSLYGPNEEPGTGFLKLDQMISQTSKQGVSGALSQIAVQWYDSVGNKAGISHIDFFANEQGKEAIEGKKYDAVAIDEECDLDVFNEACARVIASGGYFGENTRGNVLITATPDHGYTEFIQKFMPTGNIPVGNISPNGAYVDVITAYDVPHRSVQDIESFKLTLQPRFIKPKIYGLPDVSSGSVWPVDEAVYVIPFMKIPDSWPRAFGLDVGFKNTCLLWGAKNPNTDQIIIYDEWHQYEYDDLSNIATPASIPASIIRNHGIWMWGSCDPAAEKQHGMTGDKRFAQMYRDEGVNINIQHKPKEIRIDLVYQALITDKLKIMNNCTKLINQIRMYRRNDLGKPIKVNDHGCDALMYLVTGSQSVFTINPAIIGSDDDDPDYRRSKTIKNSDSGYY